ncbi:MAG: serine hydrolase [Micromonosporaceae bacterium]
MEAEFSAIDGVVSVWCGRLGAAPAYARLAGAPHYPASTMKVAVLAAAWRLADTGQLDLDRQVVVHDDFDSAAPGAGRFRMDSGYDSDPEVWAALGEPASLRWLARRMIVVSSNLATNLLWEQVGAGPVAQALAAAGAAHSVVRRGIEDYAARDGGLDNVMAAADLAALLSATALEQIASPEACREMRQILLDQQKNDDLPSGLPAGTPIAHKSGWITGIRHDAGVVYPDDAPPYVIVGCTSTQRPEAEMSALLGRLAAASWADRHDLAPAN